MEIDNYVEFMKSLKAMPEGDFIDEGYGDEGDWKRLQESRSGRIVVRIVEGGNEYLKCGHSLSGWTPVFAVGFSVAIEYPNGWYKSTAVESIDWENGTFRTRCSTYSFHFCE